MFNIELASKRIFKDLLLAVAWYL